jgi:prepilin-type N-terminal cleavage/methylation domain-containing protein
MLATLLKFRQKMPGQRPQRRGFSMIEMMVVIGIVGSIATISAPPIYRFVESNRLQTNTDRLTADLQYARSLSIASSQILRFTATPQGYQLSNPNTGAVIRTTDFGHDMELGANQTTDFYPWGMADAAIFNITNGSGSNQVNLLPTGLVEVH